MPLSRFEYLYTHIRAPLRVPGAVCSKLTGQAGTVEHYPNHKDPERLDLFQNKDLFDWQPSATYLQPASFDGEIRF